MSNLLSPELEIVMLCLAKPLDALKDGVKTGKQNYLIKVRGINGNAEHDAFKKQVKAVAPKKVVEKDDGTWTIEARTGSEYPPQVFNAEGDLLTQDNIPHFDSRNGDTGTAIIEISPKAFPDNKMLFSTVYLRGVRITSLNLSEKTTTYKPGTSLLQGQIEAQLSKLSGN